MLRRHPCLFSCCIYCPVAVLVNAAAINIVIAVVAIINNAIALAFCHCLGRRRSCSHYRGHSC
jgi:hypothetical protein